jgi:hypothetical protein
MDGPSRSPSTNPIFVPVALPMVAVVQCHLNCVNNKSCGRHSKQRLGGDIQRQVASASGRRSFRNPKKAWAWRFIAAGARIVRPPRAVDPSRRYALVSTLLEPLLCHVKRSMDHGSWMGLASGSRTWDTYTRVCSGLYVRITHAAETTDGLVALKPLWTQKGWAFCMQHDTPTERKLTGFWYSEPFSLIDWIARLLVAFLTGNQHYHLNAVPRKN